MLFNIISTFSNKAFKSLVFFKGFTIFSISILFFFILFIILTKRGIIRESYLSISKASTSRSFLIKTLLASINSLRELFLILAINTL